MPAKKHIAKKLPLLDAYQISQVGAITAQILSNDDSWNGLVEECAQHVQDAAPNGQLMLAHMLDLLDFMPVEEIGLSIEYLFGTLALRFITPTQVLNAALQIMKLTTFTGITAMKKDFFAAAKYAENISAEAVSDLALDEETPEPTADQRLTHIELAVAQLVKAMTPASLAASQVAAPLLQACNPTALQALLAQDSGAEAISSSPTQPKGLLAMLKQLPSTDSLYVPATVACCCSPCIHCCHIGGSSGCTHTEQIGSPI